MKPIAWESCSKKLARKNKMDAKDFIKILIIEDDPDDVLLLKEALAESSAQSFHITHTGMLDIGIDLLDKGGIDVVLLDLNLPDSRGLDTLEILLKHTNQAPVVVMSSLEDEALALEAFQQGVQDYLVKGKDNGRNIARILNSAIKRYQSVQELQASEARTRTIIEKSADGILIVDSEGVVRFVNPAAEILFGRPAKQLVGESFGFPIITNDPSEIELLRPDGSRIVTDMRAAMVVWMGQPSFLTSLRDISERVTLENKLRIQSLTDELTGLYNRRGFLNIASYHLKLANRSRKCLTLIYLDLDGLKKINDTHGHEEGDQAIIATANLLRQTFRETDILSRLGGDEFVVLTIDAGKEFTKIMVSRLAKGLVEINHSQEHPFQLSISWGFSYFVPFQNTTIEELLRQADAELYQQKLLKRRVADER
jgi:diguanylate cyclase (GGDEF)-like protein